MSSLRIVITVVIVCVLCACSFTPPVVPPVEWTYAKDAISLQLSSDPQLNLFQKRPHALVLCMYHLRDPNGFNLLVEEPDGLQRLLECSRFDGSVTFAKKLVMQPGRDLVDLFDRAEGTKYVGFVAGYYNLRKESVVRLLTVPVVEEKSWGSKHVRLSTMTIPLHLGPQEIEDRKAIVP